jgi:hypothetical protein|mmetsp:Transcript_9080/g.12350  ORF Transcript_9080/g.12350 Transcript_9080/m.12350 type:complete len:307 (+) Transcript_9080:1522-2442(+)
MLSIPFTAVYLVEAAMVIFSVDGGTLLREKKLYLLEIVCQLCSVFAYIKMFTQGSEEDFAMGAALLSFAFLLRNLRISLLLQEVRSFKVIMDMIMKMTVPLMTQLACMYIVYFVFAQIGMYGLGGLIREPNFHSEGGIPNNLYYMVNFNDLGTSITTLYAFMIINNWPAITDMMVNSSGEKWPRVYFMIFYVFIQWILLNIVIAMMLDVFTSVESDLDKEFGNLENIKKLMAAKGRMSDDQFGHFCDGVNKKILDEEIDKNELNKKAIVASGESADRKHHGEHHHSLQDEERSGQKIIQHAINHEQ